MKGLVIIALGAVSITAFAQRHDREWRFEDHESINRTFTSARQLSVDNFSGYIHVTGYDGSEVRMKVQRLNRAESSEALAEAKRDVKLDASEQGGAVRLYVDGPFRDHDRGHRDRHYEAIFDFDLEVPRGTELTLKGFNHGTIEVRKVDGDFDVHGFNGGVDMEDIGGSGSVQTFNGSVKVAFSRNPTRKTQFKTFNGSVDVYVRQALNAEMHFKTFLGAIYSDNDLGPLTIPASTGENRNGRFIYRSSDRTQVVRAGTGGPEIWFDTFNGSIRLHSKAL